MNAAPGIIEVLNQKCDVSITDIARWCGVSRTIIYHWMHGYPKPEYDKLVRLRTLYIQKTQQYEFNFFAQRTYAETV